MTSLSDNVVLPVNISASDNANANISIELADIGHTAESIAITNRMIQQMANSMYDPNPDMAFAKSLIAHHQGAIDLAKVQLKYGKSDSLKRLAQDIITAQSSEIIWFNNWLAHTDTQTMPTATGTSQDFAKGMKEMYQQMIDAFQHHDADIAFAKALIPHHKGALALSQVVLRDGSDAKIRQLADNIIVTQHQEIKFLQQWIVENPRPPVQLAENHKNFN